MNWKWEEPWRVDRWPVCSGCRGPALSYNYVTNTMTFLHTNECSLAYSKGVRE